MALARNPVLPAPALLRRVSWGAIFAGAAIAVALTALLSLMGLGIGFGSLDIAQGDSVAGAPGSTLIWWGVTSVVATGLGGFVASRLAGIPRGITGALHGLAVWAVTTLFSLWLATTAVSFALGATGSVVGTAARITGGAVSTVGGAAVSAGGAVIPSPTQDDVAAARTRVQQEADRILGQAGVDDQDLQQAQNALGAAARNIATNPGNAQVELNRLIDRLFEGPNAAFTPRERDALVTALANRAGLSRQQADQVAQRWQAQADAAWAKTSSTGNRVANRLETTAVNVADSTVDALSKVAWGMFIISFVGLVASMIGAAIGGATLGIGAAAGAAGRDDLDDDEPLVVDEDRRT